MKSVIAIQSTEGGQSDSISVELERAGDPAQVRARFLIAVAGYRIETYPVWFLGYDIATFADALRTLHRDLRGAAILDSSFGGVRMNLALVNRPRGIVSAALELSQPALALTRGTPDSIRIVIEHLRTDQSHLPIIASTLDAFLRDENVDVHSPWGTSPDAAN